MRYFELGNTGLTISRTGFGALPIQRVAHDDALPILRRAYEGGINYFDTARAYSDSEEKLGDAFFGMRDKIVISTKTQAKNAEDMWKDLAISLEKLRTDYIDIYQFHNASRCYRPGDADGLYDAALEARKKGMIRHIGITAHSIDVAFEAVESGLYETLQYPFSHLAVAREVELVKLCQEKGVGFIAMKALSGGLVTDARLPFVYLDQFPGVVPIWGIQRMWELEQILDFSNNTPEMTEELAQAIDKDRRELAGAFCRSCGYCMPCPVGIEISFANRAKQLLTRSPYQKFMTPQVAANMEKIADCIHCGVCESRCPYNLKPYETMPAQLEWFREFYKEHGPKE